MTVQIYSPSPKVGKFRILYETLNDPVEQPLLKALFGLCVVYDVCQHESGRGMEYIASGDLFQELSEGEEVPEYRIEVTFDKAFDSPEREAQRINNGGFGFVAIRQFIVRVPHLEIPVASRMPDRVH